MLTLIILILMLGILIFVHEFGHFIVAKKTGVHVDEFALGMGPIIFKFKRKNDPTLYSLRLFPVGGFCAMAGEVVEEEEKKLSKDKYMCNKKPYQKFLILVAGVTMNFLLAFIIFFLQSLIWGSSNQLSDVGLVTEDSPIAKSGIEVGDKILSINGVKTDTWDKIQIALSLKDEDKKYDFVVEKKDGTTKKYEVTPETKYDKDGNLESMTFGFGVGDKLNKGFINSIKYAFVKLYSIFTSMGLIIIKLFTGQLGLNSLSGPIGMYSVVGESAKYGFQNILYLTGYLSVNLGFINLIPFPAFDGGRILFVIIEKIKGSPVKPEVENWFHTIGFMLLMLLMIVITYQDIIRLFTK
ncbi:MAG: RIP metalloprotease RseP [Bacilli bacterium]|nr:RIP metalloprotease RseP [Bacilli bacterium]